MCGFGFVVAAKTVEALGDGVAERVDVADDFCAESGSGSGVFCAKAGHVVTEAALEGLVCGEELVDAWVGGSGGVCGLAAQQESEDDEQKDEVDDGKEGEHFGFPSLHHTTAHSAGGGLMVQWRLRLFAHTLRALCSQKVCGCVL